MNPIVWFWGSVAVLAGMLFFPASKMIWVLSVRRMQKKLGRELSADEMAGQRRRARFLAFFLCIVFSFLFNINMIGYPKHG